jgi:hypothetical protein
MPAATEPLPPLRLPVMAHHRPLQARFLADFPQGSRSRRALLALAVGLAGFYIFRSANSQKDRFKKEPQHPSVKSG